MSVNPLDRTDQRLIRLVSQYGDPLVDTQTLAEEVSLGFQETRSRLSTLAEQGWIDDRPRDGQRQWQVTSKAGLLVRTDSEPPSPDEDDDEIIDAEAEGAESSDEQGSEDSTDEEEPTEQPGAEEGEESSDGEGPDEPGDGEATDSA